jgi:hypothetical protein
MLMPDKAWQTNGKLNFLSVFHNPRCCQRAPKKCHNTSFLNWILFIWKNIIFFYYFKMSECQTVGHPVNPVPEWNKLMIPKLVRYQTKLTQSGIFLVRCQTEIIDAWVPTPALVSSMTMPSHAVRIVEQIEMQGNSGAIKIKQQWCNGYWVLRQWGHWHSWASASRKLTPASAFRHAKF